MTRASVETAVTVVILAASLFISAGRWHWPMAWAFLLVFIAFSVVAFLVLSPALIEERSKLLAGTERTDALLAGLFALLLYPGTMVVCGLDHRFSWSLSLSGAAQLAALAVFIVGYAFALWAMRVNPFFAAAVRVQKERGHQLIDRGPYASVRHPGYAGTIAAHLALPVALGSLWGLVPAGVGSLLLAVRAVREEHVLQRELAGYDEYMQRVAWRLLPGIW
jgi:protein-S-isoprenylcysteine O-methyltransferase Ste14